MEKPLNSFKLKWPEAFFLGFIFSLSLLWRLWPKLLIDPHLLTMNADVWERLAMAQYFLDHGRLPTYCLRYIAYGKVPFWYPPLGPIFLGILSKISQLDLPTVCSRIMPFFEALTPLPFYFLARRLFGRCAGYISTTALALTPSFVYWTGITTPASLTLFLLPIYIILLLDRGEGKLNARQRIIWILTTGLLLAVNFLFHLTYFFAAVILIPIGLLIFANSADQGRKLLDFLAALVFSQLITVFWWARHNLYQWWLFRLVTSSWFANPISQLKEYGITAAIISTIACALYLWRILWKRKTNTRYDWLPLVWIIVPFIETQSGTILKMVKRMDLSWNTIIKPLEGFRFYGFLAQPLALIIGWVAVKYLINRTRRVRLACFTAVSILFLVLSFDLAYIYSIFGRLQNSGLTIEEYRSALWFRNHTAPKDRIIADYYRSQMFAGVCGGKALLGGLFPLKNVNLPYISVPAVVQDDICMIYTSIDPKTTIDLMHQYGCDYIFISDPLIKWGNIGSTRCLGFGIPVALDKFENEQYFTEVYNDNQGTRIIKTRGDQAELNL